MKSYRQISLVALKVLYVNLGGYTCIKYANYFAIMHGHFVPSKFFVHCTEEKAVKKGTPV